MRMNPNNHGISLIEVMIGVAVISMIGLVMASMISTSYQQEARLGVLLEGRELSSEFTELIKSPNCGIVELAIPIPVKDRGWMSETVYDLNDGISGRFLTLKPTAKYGGLKVEKIKISAYWNKTVVDENTAGKYVAIDGSSETDFADAQTIKASLSLEVSSTKGVKAPLRAPVYLYLNDEKTSIIGCESVDAKNGVAALCESLSGQWSGTKCSLPCPAGTSRPPDDPEGMCVARNNDDQNYCPVNERCKVAAKYYID